MLGQELHSAPLLLTVLIGQSELRLSVLVHAAVPDEVDDVGDGGSLQPLGELVEAGAGTLEGVEPLDRSRADALLERGAQPRQVAVRRGRDGQHPDGALGLSRQGALRRLRRHHPPGQEDVRQIPQEAGHRFGRAERLPRERLGAGLRRSSSRRTRSGLSPAASSSRSMTSQRPPSREPGRAPGPDAGCLRAAPREPRPRDPFSEQAQLLAGELRAQRMWSRLLASAAPGPGADLLAPHARWQSPASPWKTHFTPSDKVWGGEDCDAGGRLGAVLLPLLSSPLRPPRSGPRS